MLRLASVLTLLMAGLSAHAEEAAKVVTLANGNTLSWAEFVDHINNPSKIQGTADQSFVTDRDNKKKAWEDAKKAYDNQVTVYDNANKAYVKAENDLASWKSQIEAHNATIANYQKQIAAFQKQIDTKKEEIAKNEKSISDKKTDIGNLRIQLNGLPKKIVTKPVAWLEAYYQATYAFYLAFNNESDELYVWYKRYKGGRAGNALELSFVDPSTISDETVETNYSNKSISWTKATQSELYTNMTDNAVAYLNVYFGKDYAAKNEGNPIVNVTSYTPSVGKDFAVQFALGAVKEVRALAMFQENVTTDEYEDNVKEQAKTIIQQIGGLEEEIGNLLKANGTLQGEIDGIKTNNIAPIETEIAKVELLISGLNTQIHNYTVPTTTGGESEQAKLKRMLDEALREKNSLEAVVASAKAAYDAAEAALKEAVAAASATAIANYKTITLTGDVTVTTPINSYDGSIFGEHHIITVASPATELFKAFSGSLTNVAVNGTIGVNTIGAKFSSVTNWATTGNYYDAKGTATENIGTLGELGFIARESYGVNFDTKKVVALADESKVYNITVRNTAGASKYYAVKTSAGFVSTNGQVNIPANVFVETTTADLADDANIIYNGTCKNVVITDPETFYAPYEFQADKVTYNRTFKAGKNAICLPFEMKSDMDSNIEFLSTFYNEDSERFWFKKVSDRIDAYTPILMHANAAFQLGELTNVVIKPTPAKFMQEDEGDANDPSKSYGILKRANREEFFGGPSEGFRIYGLANGKFVQALTDAIYPAFRMVVYSAMPVATVGTDKAPALLPAEKGIGILEEDGTLSVTDMTADVASVTVAGMQGEIVFTSEADYNTVGIYAVDGHLAAMADVKAGTTTVNVPAGLYIVLGQKVVVK